MGTREVTEVMRDDGCKRGDVTSTVWCRRSAGRVMDTREVTEVMRDDGCKRGDGFRGMMY